MAPPANGVKLNLDAIQGDVLIGLQKNVELFDFFKITNVEYFNHSLRRYLVPRLTSAQLAHERDLIAARRQRLGLQARETWFGVNLGFTNEGLTQLLGPSRPQFEASFERGASHPDTIAVLNDPAPSTWVSGFLSDRIDGVLLIAGPDEVGIQTQHAQILREFGNSIKSIYTEIGSRRPGAHRSQEHFGFTDGVSQPEVRGLASQTPDRELIWPGEFVLGYPRQDWRNPETPGSIAATPAKWARDGSYLVFRRLEQGVPEFRRFVAAEAGRKGTNPTSMASRMVGRWPSGAPLELTPWHDDPALGADQERNNKFGYAKDPLGDVCPLTAHIRLANPRDTAEIHQSAGATPRILRAGISFGPEVGVAETTTTRSRGLMFVCYQSSIELQFEHIQRQANRGAATLAGRRTSGDDGGLARRDLIIGQAAGAGTPNSVDRAAQYALRDQWKRLEKQNQFVLLTAAGYFFMPSLDALRTGLA